MKISIVLAAYNGERFLREQLDSFVAQTLQPDEVVVCDDNSQDSTWAILNGFSESAPFRVRLYSNPSNLGYGANFVKAIGLAEGDLIFMSDQDDVWLPDKLARMAVVFADSDAMVVTCDQEVTDENLRPRGQSVLAQLRAAGAPQTMFAIGCCTAIRSELRELLLPLPEGVTSHDVWIDVLARSLGLHSTLPEVLQYHRRHGGNASPDELIPVERVGRISQLRRRFAISPDQLTFLYPYYEGVIRRLEELPESALPLGGRRERALAYAKGRLGTLQARHAIAQRSRWRRPVGIARLLLRGGYAQVSGWKSAVKDLLAPRIPS